MPAPELILAFDYGTRRVGVATGDTLTRTARPLTVLEVRGAFPWADIDRLVKTCKGKIPIMLDLDRQLLPFGSPQDMRDHVREAVTKMYLPEGGLGINLEIGMEVPLENVDALLGALDEMRVWRG